LTGSAPNVAYTPAANYTGADSFTFKANDGTVDSNTATVSITVTAVNDPPVAVSGTVNTTAGTPVNGTLVAPDIDSSTLTYATVANGTKGTATITNATTGAYTYTPNAAATGTDTFTFKANDGTADSNIATITVTIAANHPPVASNGSLTAQEDKSAKGTLIATDQDGNRLTYRIVSNGSKGTATITNASMGIFTYVPNANSNGSDTFTFRANDSMADSNLATISITITPVNDAPVATNGSLTTTKNTPAGGTLQASDVDADALTFSIFKAPKMAQSL
jgi:VCBS repeat-containing protein